MTTGTIDTILVATELTEESEDALRTAVNMTRSSGAAVHVLHAVKPPTLPYWEARTDAVTTQGWVHDGRRNLREQVERVMDGVEPAGQKVVLQTPFQAIVDHAKEVGASLIVLGTHRHRGVGDGLVGTTADRVMRTAPVPCLIANGVMPSPPRRVLVPIDLSEPARGALHLVLGWLRHALDREGGEGDVVVELLHILPRELKDMEQTARDDMEKEFQADVEHAKSDFGDLTGIDVRVEVRSAPTPSEGILKAAKEKSSQLIVMGTHGYGALGRTIIGSVASAVARQAPSSVLLVPPSLWREGEEA